MYAVRGSARMGVPELSESRASCSRKLTPVATPKPVPPFGWRPCAWSTYAGPAMSRWTQRVLPMNSCRNRAAVMEPPYREPVCLRSATSLFSDGLRSASRGMRQ